MASEHRLSRTVEHFILLRKNLPINFDWGGVSLNSKHDSQTHASQIRPFVGDKSKVSSDVVERKKDCWEGKALALRSKRACDNSHDITEMAAHLGCLKWTYYYKGT